MRPSSRWIVFGFAAVTFACGPSYRPPLNFTVSPDDSILVERGRYISEHVTHCAMCHTARTFTGWDSIWEDKGPRYAGGLIIDDTLFKGFPGRVVVPNLTPDKETGLGDWSDG